MSGELARRRPGSLPLAMLRHVGVLLVAVALVYGASQVAAIEVQPMVWIGAAAVAGALAGLLDRGWIGLAFVVAGLALGAWLTLALGHHGTNEAAAAFATAASLYVAMLLAGAAAYLIVRLVRRQLAG